MHLICHHLWQIQQRVFALVFAASRAGAWARASMGIEMCEGEWNYSWVAQLILMLIKMCLQCVFIYLVLLCVIYMFMRVKLCLQHVRVTFYGWVTVFVSVVIYIYVRCCSWIKFMREMMYYYVFIRMCVSYFTTLYLFLSELRGSCVHARHVVKGWGG